LVNPPSHGLSLAICSSVMDIAVIFIFHCFSSELGALDSFGITLVLLFSGA